MNKKSQFKMTLRVVFDPGHEASELHRLRRLLKSLLRAYGFRCVTIERIDADGPMVDASFTAMPFHGSPLEN